MHPRKRDPIQPRICSRNVLVNGLRFFWVIAVIWCEVGIFFYSLKDCKWPDQPLKQHGSVTSPAHIILISDPQVRHSLGKLSWIGAFRQYIAQSDMRKSWSIARRLNPQAVFCLGDMLASGRLASTDEEYEQYYSSFREMFPVDEAVPMYYLPGNNDVGLGRSVSISKIARRRYQKHFGSLNQKIIMGGHTLVLIDAPGIVEEDYQRHAQSQPFDQWKPIPGGPVEFVKAIGADPVSRENPVILLSHIPLAHPETKVCGPLREHGTIRRGVGHGYQNTLDKQTTEFLLQNLRPSAVFSGDDRDYCEYSHRISASNPDSNDATLVREVTVKSFSLAMNIHRPGFQLLSLAPPSSSPSPQASLKTFADIPCSLPDRYAIINSFYIPSLLLTALILVLSNFYRARTLTRLSPFSPPTMLSPEGSRPSSPTGRSASGAWSPWGPFSPFVSQDPARSPLPTSMRITSNAGAPAFRAFSKTSTPTDTPLLTPSTTYNHDEEDDTFFPPQYAVRREHRPGHNGSSWPSGYDEQDHEDEAAIFVEKTGGAPPVGKEQHRHQRSNSQFLPAPGYITAERRNWSYSWSFVLGGRRRRMTIRLPSGSSLRILGEMVGDIWNWRTGGMRRRGLVWKLVGDGIAVAWPALLVWGVIVRWMF